MFPDPVKVHSADSAVDTLEAMNYGGKMRWDGLNEQPCSLSRTLSVIGERWTPIILRDCFLGVRRFDDFQKRLGISRTVLAERLNSLVDHGVLDRVAYSDRPPRYEYMLSDKGLALYPVLLTMVEWGDRFMTETADPPVLREHRCGHRLVANLSCSQCGEAIDPRQVTVAAGRGFDDPRVSHKR